MRPESSRAGAEARVMMFGLPPTGFECGALNGPVRPGSPAVKRLGAIARMPLLFHTVAAPQANPVQRVTDHPTLDDTLAACETFGDAARTKARKVIIAALIPVRQSGWPVKSIPRRGAKASHQAVAEFF